MSSPYPTPAPAVISPSVVSSAVEEFDRDLRMVTRAKEFATTAHAGQFRRDGVTPYIDHCADVARRVGHSAILEAAAWLHDSLEDTDTTAATLRHVIHMPQKVVDLVVGMTRKSGQTYEEFIECISAGGENLRALKTADILSNLADAPTEKQIRKYAAALTRLTDLEEAPRPERQITEDVAKRLFSAASLLAKVPDYTRQILDVIERADEHLHGIGALPYTPGSPDWDAGRAADDPPSRKDKWNHTDMVLVYYACDEERVGNFGTAYYHYEPPFEAQPRWIDFSRVGQGRQPVRWWPLPPIPNTEP